MEDLHHTHYSPDFTQSIMLSRSFQHFVQEKKFLNCEEVKTNTEYLYQNFFAQDIKHLPNRWDYAVNIQRKCYLD